MAVEEPRYLLPHLEKIVDKILVVALNVQGLYWAVQSAAAANMALD